MKNHLASTSPISFVGVADTQPGCLDSQVGHTFKGEEDFSLRKEAKKIEGSKLPPQPCRSPPEEYSRRYTVRNFANKYPEFCTESSLRWMLFHSKTNGMNEFNVVERIGRRVIINEENFFKWLEAINRKEGK